MHHYKVRPVVLILFLMPLILSCNTTEKGQPDTSNENPTSVSIKKADTLSLNPFAQKPDPKIWISQFVRRIFEDSKGNLWMGTNTDGVVRYDGTELEYFSTNAGLGGSAVNGISEDGEGNLWFATNGGLTKFDGSQFTNFGKEHGLKSVNLKCLHIDDDKIWVGGNGIHLFDGVKFTSFTNPRSSGVLRNVLYSSIHSITKDSKGRMWLGTNMGAHYFDGIIISVISESNGLSDNRVNDVVEFADGVIMIATHEGGVNIWDGNEISHVGSKQGVNGNEVYDLNKDAAGNIWFPVEGHGVYRFDGEEFVNFHKTEGLDASAIQSTHADSKGRIWAGGYGGLYCYDYPSEDSNKKSFFYVSKKGPWPK